LFIDADDRVLACGWNNATGHGNDCTIYPDPILVHGMAGVRVQAVAAGFFHCLALGWDGRVFSWGSNEYAQLGHGDSIIRVSPAPIDTLEEIQTIDAACEYSLAVTRSGEVIHWGHFWSGDSQPGHPDVLLPTTIQGFGRVRVRRVRAGSCAAFAIGEDAEVFSWGESECARLGHGNAADQPVPKRVEALRGVRVSSVGVGDCHALALTEEGVVYAWGGNSWPCPDGSVVDSLPKPIETLRGMKVVSIGTAGMRSFAITDTGELWAWGLDSKEDVQLGHGERARCPLPKPIQTLRQAGIKVDAVCAGETHALALADDGSVYAWGGDEVMLWGVPGLLGMPVPRDDRDFCYMPVLTPKLIPRLHVAGGRWSDHE
jgi:hypothetical protein